MIPAGHRLTALKRRLHHPGMIGSSLGCAAGPAGRPHMHHPTHRLVVELFHPGEGLSAPAPFPARHFGRLQPLGCFPIDTSAGKTAVCVCAERVRYKWRKFVKSRPIRSWDRRWGAAGKAEAPSPRWPLVGSEHEVQPLLFLRECWHAW